MPKPTRRPKPATTGADRQRRLVAARNAAARALGWPTWDQLGTAAARGLVRLAVVRE